MYDDFPQALLVVIHPFVQVVMWVEGCCFGVSREVQYPNEQWQKGILLFGLKGGYIPILLMEELLHQLIWRISHFSWGLIDSRWCRISSINSTTLGSGSMKSHILESRF